ncbi:MAG: GNAT family N-acetyltransferase [Novosphingobium sp.]
MGTQEWSERLITRSGCLFDVRPFNPGDEAKLPGLFEHVSAEDKAFRKLTGHGGGFMLVDADHHREMTFVALVGQEAELIAAATLDCNIERSDGTVAMVIRSDFKHDGISWELLAHVERYAEAIGVISLESVEASENHAAIALEREMGFTQLIHPYNPSLVMMRKPLGQS